MCYHMPDSDSRVVYLSQMTRDRMARLGIIVIAVALLSGITACESGSDEPVSYELSISSSTGGSVVAPGEGVFTLAKGTSVDLVATASEGYHFIEWIGQVSTVADVYDPTTTITILADYSVHASFARAIWDWHDLDAIRDNLGGSYALMNDLDSATAGHTGLASPEADGGKGWQPIGTSTHGFTGTFHGRGHCVRDMFIDRPDEDHIGLFGYIAPGGVVKNTGVTDIAVVGRDNVGGLVGWNEGGSVGNTHSAGIVIGESSVGGLVGCNSRGTVSSSCSTSSVIGNEQVGGLVGLNYRGAISNTCSVGNVEGDDRVGGLVGHNYQGAVSNSYSGSSVNGNEYVGGLAGQNQQGAVSNSFWDVETSGTEVSSGGIGKTTAEMQDIATFADMETEGLHEPWDIIAVAPGATNIAFTWSIVDGVTYPFLSTQATT